MRLPVLAALLTCAFAAPMLAGGVDAMTDAERTAFRAEVKAYLLENPEVLMEAMDVLQNRQAKAEVATDKQLVIDHKADLFADAASWVGGNPDGDVTVVEFMDYRCGYCRKAYQEVEDLVKADGNIRLILKEYPILGDASVASARFAIAVRQLHGDDAYKKSHDALITLRGEPDADTLSRLASDLGFDAKSVLDKMASPEVTAVIAQNQDLGSKMSISGTPTFIIDSQMLRGYVPLDGMQQIVAAERKS
ncbi:MAG: Disulfide bond formation protein DsbA [Cypionkella sp.]|uniref:DsbA family protein n=1 Tax=Cypionkella sp. TaxID=2811411 RepID=UPI002607BD01|nr:DsbA family protein [Cypionkella sp.]MDB5661401.1 Disulfide bond formation protein DsbA [Cypionkella sp.]